MTELWLIYVDHEGQDQRLLVDKDEFVIGRHAAANLCYPDDRLSREHLRIDRVQDDFAAVDCGSTNGSRLNGEDLVEPTVLRAGDELLLGDRFRLSIELGNGEITGSQIQEDIASVDSPVPAVSAPQTISDVGNSNVISASTEGDESSFSAGIFVAAAIFGVVIVAVLGVLVFMFASGGESKPERNDIVYKNDPDDDPLPKNTKTDSTPKVNNNSVIAEPTLGGNTTDTPANNVANTDLSETAKTERNAAMFLRKMAMNDPRAFLTSAQAKLVGSKIKQISSSSALSDNINAVRKSSSQIVSVAKTKSLQPQFLAAAVITRLGNSRGDLLKTAHDMADVFGKMRTPVGNDLSDDALLMVAFYQQGSTGDVMKMINMLQRVVNEYPETPHSVRTIWFLHDKGKISDSEYDFAITFLAIGTIVQNPRDFGVNSDALNL